MGGAELRGSCEDYFDDISYLLFVTDCRRLNTHFRPIAAGSDYMLGAAHLCSCSTLLLKDEHPPAGLPFDAARSPDATRGATPARTRMASATCPGLTLDGPRLPILGCTLPNCGAARGEDSLLQSPAECGRMHAPVDSETDLTLAV